MPPGGSLASMRILPCLAMMIVGGAAFADPVTSARPLTLAPVVIASALQAKLRGEFGVAEGTVLQRDVSQQLARATAKGCGSGSQSIAVVIEHAAPTHPTRQQLSDNPSLDYLRSVFLGGATLSASVYAADHAELARLSHSYYPDTLPRASASGYAWADAHLAIGQFADKVAAFCRHRTHTP